MKTKLLSILVPIADYALKLGIYSKHDVILTEAIKTEQYYFKVLRNITRTFYDGFIDEFDFVGIFADLISGQIRRAYIEGLRLAGFDPDHMTGAMYAEIDAIVQNEHNFVLNYAADLVKAKEDGAGWEQFLPRINLWVNRYQDVVNRGALAGALKTGKNMKWERGATEVGCHSCVSLDGIVATAHQWDVSGYRPQQPPNGQLDCSGWGCDCDLLPTDDEPTIDGDDLIIAV